MDISKQVEISNVDRAVEIIKRWLDRIDAERTEVEVETHTVECLFNHTCTCGLERSRVKDVDCD